MYTSCQYRLFLPIQHLIQFHILSIAFFITDEKYVGIFATVALYKFYLKTQENVALFFKKSYKYKYNLVI